MYVATMFLEVLGLYTNPWSSFYTYTSIERESQLEFFFYIFLSSS